MTTRPGNLGLDSLRFRRGKHLCHLLLITRKDRETLAVTDHDRAITFEGQLYRPIIFGALSADRREGALRSGDQDAQGIIDEIYITASDLDAQNYLGAEVRQVIVDWTKPYIVLARHRRWIRKMTRSGQAFTATLEGRAQQLQRPQAGRFGGFFTTKCQYRLGGRFCKTDTSPWVQMATAGLAGGGITTNTQIDFIVDVTKTWTIGQWIDYYVLLSGGAQGSGQLRKIIDNNANTVYVDPPFDSIPGNPINYAIGLGPSVNSVLRARYEITFTPVDWVGTYADQWYRDGSVIWTTGNNAGTVSPIADYRTSDRKVVLLTPTAFDINFGDRGIVQPGCDGLIGTCRDKYNNILNFGGDPYAPSAQQLIEPPEEP